MPPDERGRETTGLERGSAVVEFALVLPLILMMALVLLQVGLVVRDRLQVEAAARAGARMAAVSQDAEAIRAAALGAAPALEPTSTGVSVERVGARSAAVTVVIEASSPVRVPLVEWLLPDSVDMGAAVTTRQEFG